MAAIVTVSPVRAADERPLDHIEMVIDEIRADVAKEGNRGLARIPKTMTILGKGCDLKSRDDKQSAYSCHVDINVADQFSSYSPRRATFTLKHDFASDTWTSE